MDINQVNFFTSSSKLQQLPSPNLPEYAFVGRSNVGKSSLINSLCNHEGLARISSTPGKTQLINHFLVDENWYLVDLPGYGYARVSKKQRAQFSKMIQDYVLKRENLGCLFILVDSRHEPQQSDLDFMEFCGMNGVPFVVVMTKLDKLRQSEVVPKVEAYQSKMLEFWEELPDFFLTSSAKGLGMQEIRDFIGDLNGMWKS